MYNAYIVSIIARGGSGREREEKTASENAEYRRETVRRTKERDRDRNRQTERDRLMMIIISNV